MKATRGCRPCDGGTLQKQAMPMDLDVYWCDGSVRERWKLNVPSTINRSINVLDSQNHSRAKDLVISIINNQHPLKRRTTKEGLERMKHSGPKPGIPVSKTVIPVFAPGTVRAGGRFLGRKTPKSVATQSFCHGRFSDSGVIKVGLGDLAPKSAKPTATTRFWGLDSRPTRTRFFDVLTARVFQEKKP